MERTKHKTFVSIAADYGPLLGLCFVITFFAALYSLQFPALSFLVIASIVAVPVTVWIMMRRTWRKSLCTMPYATLWTQGIVAFACGAIFLAVSAFVFFKWVDPDLFLRVLQAQEERWTAQSTEQSLANARALHAMIEGGAVPRAGQLVVQLVCLTIFSGSMLSMLVAFIVRLGRK
ncbi:MAG: DUF4199 domain-containing protein [Clostridiales bacterium]|nr:DUF4199 domain-containing protein [Clostridiales bacterium]